MQKFVEDIMQQPWENVYYYYTLLQTSKMIRSITKELGIK